MISPSASGAEPVGAAPPLTGPVLMAQRWVDVAFLHWAVPAAALRPLMPPGVRPDEHDGSGWVGLVPFRMVGASLGRGPAVPRLGTFLETNVRTYGVDATGRRGVVFASLDADRLAVVAGARAGFGLPYRWSAMSLQERTRDGHRELLYRTRLRGRARTAAARAGDDAPPGTRVHLRVVPGSSPAARRGGPSLAEPGLLPFLTARWGLHVRHLGRDWHVPNEHAAWPLVAAEVLDLDDGLLAAAGLPGTARRPPDHVAFSSGVATRFGLPGDAARPRR